MSWWDRKARNARSDWLIGNFGYMPSDQEISDLKKNYAEKVARKQAEAWPVLAT